MKTRDLADALGISRSAADLYLDSEVIDLHIDSFIWHRTLGYDLYKRHTPRLFKGRLLGQVDIPRLLDAEISGGTWVITTNPLLDRRDRPERFFENLRALETLLGDHPRVTLVRNLAEYRAARAAGNHAAFIGVQGGNALDHSLDSLTPLADQSVLRITLLHLSSSRIGATSSPMGALGVKGLTSFGADYVRRLNELKIFVDLAHISKQAFWQVAEVHDPALPLLVSHTGIAGAYDHWRNLDDDQVKRVAKSGGTIGVLYHSEYLGDPLFRGRRESIVRHMEHVVSLVGPRHVSLGSDWDGAIFTPRDMPTCSELPCLVDTMLQRGWCERDIKLVLGLNFLRVVEALRG